MTMQTAKYVILMEEKLGTNTIYIAESEIKILN